jgi:hypothetical protein
VAQRFSAAISACFDRAFSGCGKTRLVPGFGLSLLSGGAALQRCDKRFVLIAPLEAAEKSLSRGEKCDLSG